MLARQIIHLISAALAFAGALVALPDPASAASATGTASAVIYNAVSVRSSGSPDFPAINVTRGDVPSPRATERPCNPADPASARCRMILVELQ